MLDYAWLMLLFPALGTLLIALFGRRLSKGLISWLAPGMVLLSFAVAVSQFVALLGLPAAERHHELVLWQWMTAGAFSVDLALLIDQLSVTMALVVTGVGFIIHVYSVGYMHDDPRYGRFFAYMNFFILMMLTLVLANNYLLMYVGWEGVGLASYLLIGFWFEKPSAADAGKKAFIVNRIGDFGLALAIMFIWSTVGTLRFADVFANAEALAGAGVITTVTMLLLLAATGKSAQLPLYVWLPDAMEGPTPVSALIHAATMVTAGVYMTARSAALFNLAPTSALWVAGIGAATALFAATIALTQTDLKRILAYSTISQLGYMFLAVGVGAYASGIFHLATHAFFKALLFLAAGSVMHALAGELNINKMGNLRAKMPITYWTYLIGAAALAGIPLFSGFFSKDEILWYAWQRSPLLWLVGLITAALTAIYSFRSVFVPFWGEERDKKLHHHAHESPRVMTVPLIVLAAGAVLAGYIGLPHLSLIEGWLEPVFHAGKAAAEGARESAAANPIEWVLLAVSALVALAGAYFAYYAYVLNTELPKQIRASLGWFGRLVENKYYVDEIYNTIIVNPLRDLAGWLARAFDQRGIDGAVNGIAGVTGWIGAQAQRLQTGLVGLYALSILFGAVALVAWLVIR
ncbi:MAG: NADH-quinone oxidoreductase subunit L [Anaerolineae bacterium]